ncbi:MAG: class I SAM-dependent methyltransferase [Halioglobus sp.]|nr:class I SAM-dependent methyltransferase [Halioglobus sp.]
MTPVQQRFESPYGDLDLARYPARAGETLLAWCSADQLALEEIHRRGTPGGSITVANDAFGALCVALQPRALWTDSALSVHALRRNEEANNRPATAVVWSTAAPPGDVETVVIRIPKQLAYLEYQLAEIARCVAPGTVVLAAGMDKHLSRHTAQILERYIGPTQRHPGQRKARLFTATRDDRCGTASPQPKASYHCPQLNARLSALPNVFSRDRLDIGTRFLLAQLAGVAAAETVVDLACGNGVLGLVAAKQGLAERLVFCDESAMAIASARENARQVLSTMAPALEFHHGDGLADYAGPAPQLILCNPPFHQEHTVNDFAGRRLLDQCARELAPGGRLLLVANRHLDYLSLLRQRFSTVEKCASNAKFTVFMALKR